MEPTVDCPSFIDLRAFAMDDGRAITVDDHGVARKTLPLRAGPVEVFSLHFPAGSGEMARHAGDDFLICSQGTISINVGDCAHVLSEGDSLVLANGAGFTWTADAPATVIAMRYLHKNGGAPSVVLIDQNVDLKPSGAPLAELLVGPTPACRNDTTFLSSDGEYMCGVWDSTPYHRLAMSYRHFELMYLLQGSVTFVDELDRSQTFRKGDIFMIEQGAVCSWESCEDVAKVFAIYRPAA